MRMGTALRIHRGSALRRGLTTRAKLGRRRMIGRCSCLCARAWLGYDGSLRLNLSLLLCDAVCQLIGCSSIQCSIIYVSVHVFITQAPRQTGPHLGKGRTPPPPPLQRSRTQTTRLTVPARAATAAPRVPWHRTDCWAVQNSRQTSRATTPPRSGSSKAQE